MSAEDSTYEKQICDTNKLGNALLSGIIAEGISDNKRNAKILGKLKSLHELVVICQNDVNKLKSLRLGSCHDVLNAKDNENHQVHIEVAGRLLNKIDEILKSHVKHNAAQVISKDELQAIYDQMPTIISVREKLQALPGSHESVKEHLSIVNEIDSKLVKITSTIKSLNSRVNHLQPEVIADSADVLYLSI